MSKKTFKKALGQLYKSGKIGMNDNAFWLAEDEGD
jgi:predicted RNA-binding protein (virulence factor B family)